MNPICNLYRNKNNVIDWILYFLLYYFVKSALCSEVVTYCLIVPPGPVRNYTGRP